MLPNASLAVRRSVAHLDVASALEASTLVRAVIAGLTPEDMRTVQRNRLYALQRVRAGMSVCWRGHAALWAGERARLCVCVPVRVLGA